MEDQSTPAEWTICDTKKYYHYVFLDEDEFIDISDHLILIPMLSSNEICDH